MATILVADDRAINRSLLVTLLNYEGHRIIEASDGVEGLRLAREERPDLVITDILMPKVDGYEFIRQLRLDSRISSTPVIFSSAHYLGDESQALAEDCGVFAVLPKPCEPERILRTVREALGIMPVEPGQLQSEEFNNKHVKLLTNKLSEKTSDLGIAELQLATLIGIGQQMVSTLDPDGLLREYCEGARETIGAERASIWIVRDNKVEADLFCTSGWEDHSAAKAGLAARCDGIVSKMIEQRAPLRLNNPTGDPTTLGLSPECPDVYSFLGGPIMSATHVYGWLCLSGKMGADQFSEHDEQLIGLLLSQLSVAYDNARLYSEARRLADELNREINDRKRIEEQKARLLLQIQNQKQRMDDIVASVPGVVWEAWGQPDRSSQRINFVSDYVEEMLGYTVEEWLSTPNFWLTIVHPDDVEQASRDAAALYAGGGYGTNRFRWLTKDGRALWTEARCMVICDDSGNPIGLRGITIDVSERKLAEAEMLKAHELALESLRVKAEFLDNMNHEFRTPMNGIIGFAEILLDTDLSKGQREFLENIKESSDSLLTRINDVLELSRIGFGRITLNSRPFSLRQGLAHLGEECANAAHRKGLTLSWTVSPDVPDTLLGDLDRLSQVLVTLIANAIKFTKIGGVSIEVEREYDIEGPPNELSLRFKVGDTGIGIPRQKRMVIFDAFSQVDGSNTRRYGGMGLGLALCQGLIEIMGGRIWVESKEECGSTFYFTVRMDVQASSPEGNQACLAPTTSAATTKSIDEHLVPALEGRR